MSIRETEVAKRIVDYLIELKWTVYQEVRMSLGCPVADIIAEQNGKYWVIECKTSLSLKVMEQACYWRGFANMVSVAAPQTPGGTGSYRRVWDAFEYLGLGVLLTRNGGHSSAVEVVRPRIYRRIPRDLKRICLPQHQYFCEAGSKSGYFTPFKETCKALLRHVERNPDCTIKEAVDTIKHHYSSNSTARACLSRWIEDGVVPGIERYRDGRAFRLRLTGKD